MKKFLVLGSMVSSLVLMGAGCAANNTVTTETQLENTTTAPTEQSPQSSLPESQTNVSASSQTQTPETKPSTPAPEPTPAPAESKPETREVAIASFAFAPASITVKAGTTVKWTNKDGAPHSVVSSDGRFAASAVLSNGGSYQLKFDKPGTYAYACGLHPSMSGTIIVQ
ncbi:MAG: blue (type 1) copper domain-containing protein [Parcubacteria group bacterium Gr01-1014_13]|nr:MAG: blue (type 1) copper domain-containing protein [Parcubacteria group bacterium Gr01-1014_13]